MICPSCQSENPDGMNFCIKCGSSLKAQQETPNRTPDQPLPQTPDQPLPQTFVHTTPQAPAQTMPQTPPPRKPSSVKKIVLVAVALAVVIYVVYSIIMASNPAYRLLLGLSKYGKTGTGTVESTITVDYKGDTEALELLNEASIKMSMAVDYNKMLAEASFDILYDNKSVAKIKAGLAKEDVYIDPVNLYEKKFYYELDDEVLDVIEELKVLVRYLRQANIKIDQKKYADIFKETMGDNIKGSLGKVTLTMDGEVAFDFLIALCEEAADDEKLIESLRKNAQDTINKILKDKHEFEVLFDEDRLEDMLEQLEDEDDFADMVQSSLERAAKDLESRQKSMEQMSYPGMPELEMTFQFGLFQNIKSLTYTVEMENPNSDEKVTVTSVSKIRNGARFTNFNRKNAIEILDVVTDEDEMQEIAEDVMKKLVDNIKKNKKLAEDIEDKTGLDVSDIEDEVLDSMF